MPGKENHVCKLKKSLYGLKSRLGSGIKDLTLLSYLKVLKGPIMIVVSV